MFKKIRIVNLFLERHTFDISKTNQTKLLFYMNLVKLQQLNLTAASVLYLNCLNSKLYYFLVASFCQDYQESSDTVWWAAYQSSRSVSHPHGWAFLQQNQRGESNTCVCIPPTSRLLLWCAVTFFFPSELAAMQRDPYSIYEWWCTKIMDEAQVGYKTLGFICFLVFFVSHYY